MPLNGNDRAQAIYNAVANQPNFAGLTSGEQATVKAQLQRYFGADTSYLVGNATITPDSFENTAGQPVQVTPLSGTGATTAPSPIAGTGKLT